jgi:hypothetical protein
MDKGERRGAPRTTNENEQRIKKTNENEQRIEKSS